MNAKVNISNRAEQVSLCVVWTLSLLKFHAIGQITMQD